VNDAVCGECCSAEEDKKHVHITDSLSLLDHVWAGWFGCQLVNQLSDCTPRTAACCCMQGWQGSCRSPKQMQSVAAHR
jgi:hypothetical protein